MEPIPSCMRLPARIGLIIMVATLALFLPARAPAQWWGTRASELERLAPLLNLGSGSIIAEIGAGEGAVAIAAAERVAPTGHVYATEIDPNRIREIQGRISASGLNDISVVEAAADNANLPPQCCDAIYMIGVYHHLTEPLKTDASIFEALRPGGRLAIVDFRPSLLLKPWTPKGIPANRGGHGIPENILEDELKSSGFQITQVYDHWGNSWLLSNYCVLATKSSAHDSATR
jgi:ubiquinone/menaquinone biosynthesis C-methylase UbiE